MFSFFGNLLLNQLSGLVLSRLFGPQGGTTTVQINHYSGPVFYVLPGEVTTWGHPPADGRSTALQPR